MCIRLSQLRRVGSIAHRTGLREVSDGRKRAGNMRGFLPDTRSWKGQTLINLF